MRAEQRDRALFRAIAAFDMQRFPGAFFFVFTRTKRVLRRMPHGGFGNVVGLGAADVDDAQTEGASNSGVTTETMSGSVMPTIDTDLLTDRTVHTPHRPLPPTNRIHALHT